MQQQPDDLTIRCAQIREFLVHAGIEAEVRLGKYDPLIILTREQYDKRRGFLDSWFKLVEEHGDYLYFHERIRGTGATIDTIDESR